MLPKFTLYNSRDRSHMTAATSRLMGLLCKLTSFFLVAQVVSDAAGQGVTITGSKTFNNWNWPNAVIFAATVITTIGVFSRIVRVTTMTATAITAVFMTQ